MEGLRELFGSVQFWGVIAALITSAAAVFAAIIARKKTREELGAISTGALAELTAQFRGLSKELQEERVARQEDCLRFEVDFEELRTFYRKKLSEIEEHNIARINKLKAQNKSDLVQLKLFYEIKIERIEQGHRDRVNSLKERIRALENDSGVRGPK